MRLKALVFVATLLAAQTAFAPVATFKPLEGSHSAVEVQFNPKELSVDKSVPWTKTKKSTESSPELEFTAAEPRTLTVELMFDLFEQKGDVSEKYVAPLLKLAEVDRMQKEPRPPLVLFQWGRFTFKGAIASVNVKYTMFAEDGTPLRATANVKMKHADSLTTKKEADKDNDKD